MKNIKNIRIAFNLNMFMSKRLIKKINWIGSILSITQKEKWADVYIKLKKIYSKIKNKVNL